MMPDSPDEDHVFKEWQNQIPNDSFAFYDGASDCIVYKTDEFVLDQSVSWPSSKTLTVYAENVSIADNLRLESRKLAIFCNSLKLSQKAISLSVSGANGQKVLDNAETGPSATGNGAGSLTIYIENLTEDLIPSQDENGENHGLYLYADGGDGAVGSNNTKAGKGGNGGNGGSGGSINVFFSHKLYDDVMKLDAIMDCSTKHWPTKVEQLEAWKHDTSIADSAVKLFLTESASYSNMAKTLDGIEENLIIIDLEGAPGKDSIKDAKTKLLDQMAAFVKQVSEPSITSNLTSSIKSCYDSTEALRVSKEPQSGKPWPEFISTSQALVAVLESILSTTPAEHEGTALRTAYNKLINEYRGASIGLVTQMQFSFSANGGQGGMGGKGAKPEDGYGDSGKEGAAGTVQIQGLCLSEDMDNLDVAVALASSDQCQMLCNLADMEYFNSSASSNYASAQAKYATLSRRLSFVPKMVEELGKSHSRPLIEAYLAMEIKKLAFNAIPQLMAIKSRADICLERIATGLDMFGHPPGWVPRLSYTTYHARIQSHIEAIEDLEKKLKEFGSNTDPALQAVKKNIDRQLGDVEFRIKILESSDSVLSSSATLIQAYTPQLKKKRQLIQDTIAGIKKEIDEHINMDSSMLLDALTMVAFAPNLAMAGIQFVGVYKKATSSIQALDGSTVEKDYVVQQFGTANNSFASLQDGYKNRSNSLIEIDDPGADKLITTKSDLIELVDKFKKVITSDNAEGIKRELDAFVKLIQKRNDAVMRYNAGVQLLMEARAERAQYEQLQANAGEALLSLDPTIPASRFWMRKSINDARYAAIEALLMGERSLRFWALIPPFDMSSMYQGLPTSTLLAGYNKKLEDMFNNCVEEYGKTIYSQFPSAMDREHDGQGFCFNLPDDEFEAFKESAKTNSDGNYQIYFNIPVVEKSTTANESSFAGYWDVRLDQAHIWLFGAQVQPGLDKVRRLKASLVHLGSETIVKYDKGDKQLDFVHDTVALDFSYDPLNVVDFPSSSKAKKHSNQQFPGVFRGQPVTLNSNSLAPIGPFGEWRLTVSPKYNVGLDFTNLSGVGIEFWATAASYE
ncbi:hypothetical protein V8C35DRAFT_292443 [Trichoderma chlorosporum]